MTPNVDCLHVVPNPRALPSPAAPMAHVQRFGDGHNECNRLLASPLWELIATSKRLIIRRGFLSDEFNRSNVMLRCSTGGFIESMLGFGTVTIHCGESISLPLIATPDEFIRDSEVI